jgi:hypothetical protein
MAPKSDQEDHSLFSLCIPGIPVDLIKCEKRCSPQQEREWEIENCRQRHDHVGKYMNLLKAVRGTD